MASLSRLRVQSFWTLKLEPDSRVADASNAQLAARPCTWGLGIGLIVLILLAPFYLFYDSYRRWSVAPPGDWSCCGAMVEFVIAGLITYGVVKVLFDHCRNGSQRKRQWHWSVVNRE